MMIAFAIQMADAMPISTPIECRLLPVLMKGLQGIHADAVACGWRHSMVVDTEGRLYTCGWSSYGQLGLGDFATKTIPEHVTALEEPVCTFHLSVHTGE
jgi:alpha-tubulin suppressor-like RCC1 family protein